MEWAQKGIRKEDYIRLHLPTDAAPPSLLGHRNSTDCCSVHGGEPPLGGRAGGGMHPEAGASGRRLAGDCWRLWLVAPLAAEEFTAVLGDHRCYPHYTHDEENGEEDNRNHQDWHIAPLAPIVRRG